MIFNDCKLEAVDGVVVFTVSVIALDDGSFVLIGNFSPRLLLNSVETSTIPGFAEIKFHWHSNTVKLIWLHGKKGEKLKVEFLGLPLGPFTFFRVQAHTRDAINRSF